MRLINLKQHQQIMLNILIDFATFCDEHNLTYFLDAGTLLGAVRHKGFIPWDNDVDVCMLREDYDKFCDLLKQQNDHINDHIVLERPENTMYQFLKIGDTRTKLIEFPDKYPMPCYIYIDVFCKDYLDSKSSYTKHLCKKSELLALQFWFNKYSIHAWKNYRNPIKKIVGFFGRHLIKNPNKPIIKQERMIRKHLTKRERYGWKYVTTLVNGEYNKIARVECFDGYSLLEFVGHKFKCPKLYDEYLSNLYGPNYMIPPKENERWVHDVKIYIEDGVL